MADPFDPYLKWLGIPKTQQPPNLYRLLGVEVFETDPEVISHAADQRMAHLRNFGTGKHAGLSQKLLNEVATARVRLLNAEEKARYDQELRQQLAPAPTAPAAGIPPAIPPKPVPVAAPRSATLPTAGPAVASGGVASTGVSRPAPQGLPSWLVPAAIGLGVLVGAIVLALALPGGDGPGEQTQTPGQPADGPVLPAVGDTPAGVPLEEPEKEAVEEPAEEPSSESEPDPVGPEEGASSPSEEFEPPNMEAASEPDSVPPAEPTPEPPSEPDTPEPTPSIPDLDPPEFTEPPPVLAADRRETVPPEDARQRARQDILEIFGGELKQARTMQAKAALLSELANEGRSEQNGPASRYVLLNMALDLAAETGDLANTLNLADSLIAAFQVDPYETKADALKRVGEVVVKVRGALPVNGQITDLARTLSNDALEAGNLDAARQALDAGIPSARKLGDRRLLVELQTRGRYLDRLGRRWELVKLARPRLEVEPDNPKANLVAGAWDCFIAGRWDEGLPRLAQGDDSELAALAARDLANPTTVQEQYALGADYDALAEKKEGIEAERTVARAVYWYRRAGQQVQGGLLRARIDKRLRELGESSSISNYALQFSGGGDYAVVNNFSYTAASPITIEAIVKAQRPSREVGASRFVRTSDQPVFGNFYAGGISGSGGIALGLDRLGWNLRYHYVSQGKHTVANTAQRTRGQLEYDTWVHVAGVYNVKEYRLFLDGQLVVTESGLGPYAIGRMPFLIGADPAGLGPGEVVNCFCGQIRAIRVSNKVRYVLSFQAPESLGVDASTVLLFSMNEGQGTLLTSPVGRAITAQIHGAKWVKLD